MTEPTFGKGSNTTDPLNLVFAFTLREESAPTPTKYFNMARTLKVGYR